MGIVIYLVMFIHESQLRESALMFSKEMSGKLILCMANGVLFKHKKEQIHVTYRKNDETRGYPIEWDKLDLEWQVCHPFGHVWKLMGNRWYR